MEARFTVRDLNSNEVQLCMDNLVRGQDIIFMNLHAQTLQVVDAQGKSVVDLPGCQPGEQPQTVKVRTNLEDDEDLGFYLKKNGDQVSRGFFVHTRSSGISSVAFTVREYVNGRATVGVGVAIPASPPDEAVNIEINNETAHVVDLVAIVDGKLHYPMLTFTPGLTQSLKLQKPRTGISLNIIRHCRMSGDPTTDPTWTAMPLQSGGTEQGDLTLIP